MEIDELMAHSSSSFGDLLDGDRVQHVYRYILADIRTNAVLDEVSFKNVTYSTVVSGVGEFGGSLSVNPETSVIDLRAVTTPGRTSLYVFRDDSLMWGGMIMKRNFSSDSSEMQIVARTFESYFYKRIQNTTKYWSDEDQLDIARWLVMSNGSADALKIDVSSVTSPRRRERTMFGYEFKTTGIELEQLAALIDGFDWNVNVYVDNETLEIKRKLDFYYPFRGLTREFSTLQFEYPGAVKSFSLNEDAESGGNMIWAIGTGEGTEQVVAFAQDFYQLSAGFPLLEETRSYKSVIRPSTLQGHADSDLERLTPPISIFEVELRSDVEPELGTYSVGDWARFRFNHSYFYDSTTEPGSDGFIDFVGLNQEGSFNQMARITQIEVRIDDSGIETVKLTLGGYEQRTEEVIQA